MNTNIGGVKGRRKSALKRLENQLKTGKKSYGNNISGGWTDLTDSDKARISKEIEILKTRV